MGQWWKENTILITKVGIRQIPIVIAAQIVGLLALIVTYSKFKSSLDQNGGYVILSFYLGALAVLIPWTWWKRNDPRYYPYYIFHLSKISTVIIIILIFFFFIPLYLYAQCKQYGVPIGLQCFNLILNPPQF